VEWEAVERVEELEKEIYEAQRWLAVRQDRLRTSDMMVGKLTRRRSYARDGIYWVNVAQESLKSQCLAATKLLLDASKVD